MKQKRSTWNNDMAVSPVVGVMLMIVVTLIIAAVVTGFAGGIVSSQKTAPTLAMDVKIMNSGSWLGSGFYATVTGVSAPIPTSDIKLVTTWSTTNRTDKSLLMGGGSAVANLSNYNYHFNSGTIRNGVSPLGYGSGVGNNQSFSGPSDSNPTNYFGSSQQFGNYTLMQGTTLAAFPAGANSMAIIGSIGAQSANGGYGVTGSSAFNYTSGTGNNWKSGETDLIQAILGNDWNNLRVGDVVNVKVIHIPSGKVIFQKDVAVTEG